MFGIGEVYLNIFQANLTSVSIGKM